VRRALDQIAQSRQAAPGTTGLKQAQRRGVVSNKAHADLNVDAAAIMLPAPP